MNLWALETGQSTKCLLMLQTIHRQSRKLPSFVIWGARPKLAPLRTKQTPMDPGWFNDFHNQPTKLRLIPMLMQTPTLPIRISVPVEPIAARMAVALNHNGERARVNEDLHEVSPLPYCPPLQIFLLKVEHRLEVYVASVLSCGVVRKLGHCESTAGPHRCYRRALHYHCFINCPTLHIQTSR